MLNRKTLQGIENNSEKNTVNSATTERSLLKLADVTAKLRSSVRYIENNYLIGLPRDFHMPMTGEIPFILPKLGVQRYANSYNSMITMMILTMMGNRSMILYGEPGLGKSTGVLLMNKLMGIDEVKMWDGFVVGNPEQGQDIFAHPDMNKIIKENQWGVQWTNLVQSPIKFFDETSRFSGYAQGLLLSMLSEKKVVYQSEHTDMPEGPFYFAANALNSGETFGIIPALRSRIDVAVLAGMREFFFSDNYQVIKKLQGFDMSQQLSTDEFALLRDATTNDAAIDRKLNKYITYFLQKIQDIPHGMVSGENQTKSVFYGKYEKALMPFIGKQAATENADITANIVFQINNGFSDRDRQAIYWYARALAVMTHQEGTKIEVNEEHIKAVFPYVAYNLLTLNSLSAKANKKMPDTPVFDQIGYLKEFSKLLWDKVKKDLAGTGGAAAFGANAQTSAVLQTYQVRWGLKNMEPVNNIYELSEKIDELIENNSGTVSEIISLIMTSLLAWDKQLTVKNDKYQQMIISGLKMMDYFTDRLEQ